MRTTDSVVILHFHRLEMRRGRKYYYYQVCTILSDENEKREFRSLLNLMKYRSDEEVEKDKYCLLYLKDSRAVKNVPLGIEARQVLEYILTEWIRFLFNISFTVTFKCCVSEA